MKTSKKILLKSIKNFWAFIVEKKRIYAANNFLAVILMLAILIIINLVAIKENYQIDLTKNKRYTLSEPTLNLLKEIDQPLKVVAFLEPGNENNSILKQYQEKSQGKIEVQFIDANQKPASAKQYGVSQFGTIIFELNDQKETVTSESESNYSGAIIRLIHPQTSKIYFTINHGEKSLSNFQDSGYSDLKDELIKNNFQVAELNPSALKDKVIPSDASVLVIAGPQSNFLSEEEQILENYLAAGGKALIMLDPDFKQNNPEKGLGDLLNKWGVEVKNGIIIEPQNGLFGDVATPTLSNYPAHQITQGLSGTFFPGALHFSHKSDADSKITRENLVSTSNDSWLETDFTKQNATFNEKNDLKGPLALALAVQKTIDESKNQTTRLVILGDSDLAINAYTGALSNHDLILNSLRWLTSQEDLIKIAPKESIDTSIYLDSAAAKTIFWTTVVGLPLILVGVGIFMWQKRKNKSQQ